LDDDARTAALIEDVGAAHPAATRVVFRWLTWHDEASPEAMRVLDGAGADLATDDSLAFLDTTASGLSFRIDQMVAWKAVGVRDGHDWFELNVRG
jgi:hypothetical protein